MANFQAKGGRKEGSGRKGRADENKLQEKLAPYEDIVLKKLAEAAKLGEFNFVKLYMEYRFGKPKEQVDITSGGDKLAQWTMIPATK